MNDQDNRKCCQELGMLEKQFRKASVKNTKLSFGCFESLESLIHFWEILLHQWRNRNLSDMDNCSNCSHFKEELPISLTIEGKINFRSPQQEFKK